jgi:Putative transposase
LRSDEFMRRFLLHVLPSGFHRIRHYGLLANANRKTQIATARELLHQPAPELNVDPGARSFNPPSCADTADSAAPGKSPDEFAHAQGNPIRRRSSPAGV